MRKRLIWGFLGINALLVGTAISGCGSTDSNVGSLNGAVDGDPCNDTGAMEQARDGCNSCSCGADGRWVCTDAACDVECRPNDPQPPGDDCNSCSCVNGRWSCTTRACPQCQEGEMRLSEDGCNTCSCANGEWACTDRACGTCRNGETKPADDGCNTCTCSNGEWECTLIGCETCQDGQTKNSGCDTCTCVNGAWSCSERPRSFDGCSTCWCQNDTWACTANYCPPCPPPRDPGPDVGCTQAIVHAKDPEFGTCCSYSNGCANPPGWQTFGTQEECVAAPR